MYRNMQFCYKLWQQLCLPNAYFVPVLAPNCNFAIIYGSNYANTYFVPILAPTCNFAVNSGSNCASQILTLSQYWLLQENKRCLELGTFSLIGCD